ncbi:putative 2-aminoethylphosphonate ABC transporter substrate-binding protein [Fusobacterium varium]|uniref:putative 2-aminoethylphosphonate ABC transporter substrate-binding protein n=1 Tax=Fusobacterium varium TaxID=856 RepID=UPI002FF26DCB
MKKILGLFWIGVLSIVFISCGGKSEEKEITVYSSFEENYISEYIQAFNKEYPEIKINLIRDSSGIIAAKVEAEKNNPQADVLWGVATTGLLINQEYFEAFKYDTSNIESKFIDKESKNPRWVGISAWMTAFSYNIKEGKDKEISVPKSYEDLIDSKYRGEIVMSNPLSSGTGFLTVSAWIQLMGEEKAWEYMDKLNKNIKMYVHSGSAPTKMASQGETIIGIGMGFESLREEREGLPIRTIFPLEGSGWEMEIVSIMKKSQIKEEAKIFVQWAISEKAMKLYAQNRGFVTDKRIVPMVKGYPKDINKQMIDNNLVWASKNRERILKEWEKRYGKGK